jgi:hypothetical protein
MDLSHSEVKNLLFNLISTRLLFIKCSFVTGFAYTYGSICLVFSILTLIFKSENNKTKEEQSNVSNSALPGNSFKSIAKAYLLIWKIFRLTPIKKLIIIQLTLRVRVNGYLNVILQINFICF